MKTDLDVTLFNRGFTIGINYLRSRNPGFWYFSHFLVAELGEDIVPYLKSIYLAISGLSLTNNYEIRRLDSPDSLQYISDKALEVNLLSKYEVSSRIKQVKGEIDVFNKKLEEEEKLIFEFKKREMTEHKLIKYCDYIVHQAILKMAEELQKLSVDTFSEVLPIPTDFTNLERASYFLVKDIDEILFCGYDLFYDLSNFWSDYISEEEQILILVVYQLEDEEALHEMFKEELKKYVIEYAYTSSKVQKLLL